MKRDNSIDFLTLPLLFRLTQITLVGMRLVIPPSRPSGLLSLVLRRCRKSYNLNFDILSPTTAGPEEKATQICHKLLPPTPPWLQGFGPCVFVALYHFITFHLRTWTHPFASRMQGQSRRGFPQPPPAWTCLNYRITRCQDCMWALSFRIVIVMVS